MQSVQRELTTFVAHGGLPRPQLAGRFDLLFARLAYGAARSFGWSRCGAHQLACANRMAPLHGERGAQDVAIELFAALGRASRRWPAAERVPARVQLSAFLRQYCILGGSGDGVDVRVEVAAAVRCVATRGAPRGSQRRCGSTGSATQRTRRRWATRVRRRARSTWRPALRSCSTGAAARGARASMPWCSAAAPTRSRCCATRSCARRRRG